MPTFPNVVLCAATELALSIAVGWPLARLLSGRCGPALARGLAPIAGWGGLAAVSLPILSCAGFTRVSVALLCAAALFGGLAALLPWRNQDAGARAVGVPGWSFGAAALVAILPALAVWPKRVGAGILLAEPVFDHSKAAIIDDIVRLGLPPGNPFLGGVGPRIVYYYLWHFSAAVPARLWGASGWEADIAQTWFTAFASLALMMGLAVHLSGRRFAAPLVILLSLAGSLKPLLALVVPGATLDRMLAEGPWPQGWIFQASWAPQHLASASCVVVAVIVLSRLAAPRRWRLVPVLAAIAAAGFESSAWVGGIVFAAGALPIGLALLLSADGARARVELTMKAAVAVILTAAFSYPFLRDEFLANAARGAGFPIALRPIAVLGPIVPGGLRHALDLPAYWAVLLPIQLPVILFAGAAAMAGALGAGGTASSERRLVVGLLMLAAASFVVPWLFASTIANNDLGWRGVLPGVLVLTAFAAAGIAQWRATAPRLAMAAAACWALGISGGMQIVEGNATGVPARSAAVFAETPALWAAVRRHTAPDERIANNPLFLADSVRWPVNISWALLADRRSCYAGWNLARAFAPLPEAEIDRINALFERVFAGEGAPGDIRQLAIRFDCRVVVVTRSDGAWRRDPFAGSPDFRLVEEKAGEWRIYRVADGVRERK